MPRFHRSAPWPPFAAMALLLCAAACAALRPDQEDSPASDLRSASRLLEDAADGESASAISEEALHRRRAPIALERADAGDLGALVYLDDMDARRILRLRDAGNAAPGWAGIDSVTDLPPEARAALRADLVLPRRDNGGAEAASTAAFLPSHWSTLLRLQQEDELRRGFVEGSYPGPRQHALLRVAAETAHAEAACAVERDPGEPLVADHVAGYLALRDLGVVRRVVLGDYTAAGGLGLVLWKPFALSKGGDPVSCARRASPMLTPVAGAAESGGLRGAAVELAAGNVRAAVHVSSTARDAAIDSATGTAGAFDASGLHRTHAERAKRGTVREQLAGARAEAVLLRGATELRAGLCGLLASTSATLRPSAVFAPAGSRFPQAGVDLHAEGDRWSARTEIACSVASGPALAAAFTLQPATHARLALFLRHYPPAYTALHGFGFGERNGETRNEDGIYIGARLRPTRGCSLDLTADVYRIPARTTLTDLPASGRELTAATSMRLSENLVLALRVREEAKDQEVTPSLPGGVRPLAARTQRNLRAELVADPCAEWRWRLRVEGVRVAYAAAIPAAYGLLCFADARCAPLASIVLHARVTWFRTDSYDARVYAGEGDLPGIVGSVMYQGRGLRGTVMLIAHAFPGVRCVLRYERLVRLDALPLGSGRDAVAGRALGAWGVQVETGLPGG